MPRAKKDTDFIVSIEGIGKFRFARPTLLDHAMITARYFELSGGQGDKSNYLASIADAMAHIGTLCVSAPDKWENIENVPFDNDDVITELLMIYRALKDQLNSFRSSAATDSQEARVGDVKEFSGLVEDDV